MISSIRDRRTEALHRGERVPALASCERPAQRKLDQLDVATSLRDLARPGNRLEALRGYRVGYWSIRIIDRWHVCFAWAAGSPGPTEVEIVNFH